jgi:hypothetical protein
MTDVRQAVTALKAALDKLLVTSEEYDDSVSAFTRNGGGWHPRVLRFIEVMIWRVEAWCE